MTPSPLPPARDRHQRGQTLPLVVLFLVAMLGMAAFAIDVGSWYQSRRAIQSSADAAALAGAGQLPAGWTYAQSTAVSEFANNKRSGDTAVYANPTTNSAGDTVQVTVSRPAPMYFTSIFGFGSRTITATAKATVLSYTKVTSTGQVMPWGVMKASWVLGQSYSLYVDNSTPNNGALSLPVKTSGGACSGTSGASDYTNSIAGSLIVCDVSVGQIVPVKTGQNTGPTKSGIDTRITTWDPLSAIVQLTANGQAIVLKPNSPQLVLLPVVEDMSGGSTWPSGSGNVRVVGFAWFVLLQPGYANGGKTVLGTFVGLQVNDSSWTTGPYTPGANTAYTVELTG